MFKTITIKSKDGKFREVITEVGVSMALGDSDQFEQSSSTYWTRCLWDTGGSHSSITKETVEILGLQPIGEARVFSAQGEAITNIYKVCLNLPNLLFIPRLKVTETASDSAFGVILGMDVICQGDFAITNVGGVSTFSFCTPSFETIDYVERFKS
jgi:hypothetical protein